MKQEKHLFIGFGDIARRCCAQLSAGDPGLQHELVGIARSEKSCPGVVFWRGSTSDDDILHLIGKQAFDSATITLTPQGSDEEAYRLGYLEPVAALCEQWRSSGTPKRVIFVSSTSVYAQSNGEWVDHASVAEPTRATAKILRQCEEHILRLGSGVVLRFSGIYGPGRDYLLRQVMQGKGGSDAYSNRIHVEDCARAVVHLMKIEREALAPIYLASDKAPVKSREIRCWLAKRLGLDVNSLAFDQAPTRAGNKRCDSRLLETSGFKFHYPTYKEGYPGVIKRFMDDK